MGRGQKDAGRSRRRLRIAAAMLLALCVAVSLAAGDAAAKKKKKAASVYSASISPNLAVPDEPSGPTARDIIVTSTLSVGKKFKGKTVGDLNITGVQTTGTGTGA